MLYLHAIRLCVITYFAVVIIDAVVFNKIRALLGGKMEFIIVGGAPLSRETHEFIRVCLGAIVVPVS